MNENVHAKLVFLYRVGLDVLTARLVLLLSLLLAFALFAWAMSAPDWNRIACATIFAVLIFLPAARLDRSKAADRAVVSPSENPP